MYVTLRARDAGLIAAWGGSPFPGYEPSLGRDPLRGVSYRLLTAREDGQQHGRGRCCASRGVVGGLGGRR